jgi:cardiolipin synthase
MRDAGVQVQAFQPVDSVDAVWSGKINQRDHRKLLIVDGRIAFVGGINISGTYNMGSSLKPGKEQSLADGWRDTQVRISGPVVQQFQALFFASWAQAAGARTPARADYFPRVDEGGPSVVAALASEHADATEAAIHSVYLAAAEAAKRRLWITQAYFAPDRSLREALMAAARRGVDVRVLLPGFSDSKTVLSASRAIYGELLDGKVRIFEFDAAFVHAKTMVVDDSVSLVGSANMDYRSAVDNNEVTAVIIDARFAAQLGAAFLRDLSSASEVSIEQWRQRSVKERVMERAAALFWRWL